MRFSELAGALGDSFAHPEMVFSSANGNYRDRSALRTSFKRFLKGTEYEFLTLHQLRHLHASLLIGAEIDPTTVSGILGHSQVSTSVNISLSAVFFFTHSSYLLCSLPPFSYALQLFIDV